MAGCVVEFAKHDDLDDVAEQDQTDGHPQRFDLVVLGNDQDVFLHDDSEDDDAITQMGQFGVLVLAAQADAWRHVAAAENFPTVLAHT